MKFFTAMVLATVVAAPIGCSSGTSGGPGATAPVPKQPYYGQTENTFNLSMPSPAMSIKQGETKTATIGIQRGTNFDDNVTVRFASMPTGLSVDPERPIIGRGQTEAKVVFTAAGDASLGKFVIKVSGQPTDGVASSNDLAITVDKR